MSRERSPNLYPGTPKGPKGKHSEIIRNKNERHSFDREPPMQERFVVGDDNWELAETALPLNHEKVNPKTGDPEALCGKFGRPVYNDLDSPAILDSSSRTERKTGE